MDSHPHLADGGGDGASSVQSLGSMAKSLALSKTPNEDDNQGKKERLNFVTVNKTGFYGTRDLDFYDLSEDNVKQLENAFHMKDEIDVSLSLPGISEHPNQESFEEPKGTKRRDSFMKRLSVFAGSPSKMANNPERQKRNSSVSGFREFRRFSRSSSVNTQPAEEADMASIPIARSSASVRSTQTHRSSGSHSMFAKYMRPSSGDSISFGLDFTDSNDMSDIPSPSLSFDDNGLDEEYQIVVLQKKVDNIRRITNTEIKLRSLNDLKAATRPNDPRMWYTRNLRCANCVGSCPVCDIGCCIYETSRRLKNDPDSEMYIATQAERLVMNIDSMGAHVKDMSTFTVCTRSGGCGRYVCPDCCGICPGEVCRDIQCKDCKPDPWGPCDWHD